jgi:hypothetical protein
LADARFKEAFLDGRYVKAAQKDPHWRERRKAVVKWVEAGAHGDPPPLMHWAEAEGVRMFAWHLTGKKFDNKHWVGDDLDDE